MSTEEKITYGQMCDVVADEWNKRGKQQITGKDLWETLSKSTFPVLWILTMYNGAQSGNLEGVLLSDQTCAKIFLRTLDNVIKKQKDEK